MNVHFDFSIARYDSHYEYRSRNFTLDTILKEIETGSTFVISTESVAALAGGNSLRHAVDLAQSLLAKGNKAAYDEIKKGLPAFTVQGRSSTGTRQIDVFSGYVIAEYDDIEDPAYAMSVVSQNPYVHAAFVSMSGKGIKIVGRATPVPDRESYARAWYAFALMFEEFGDPDPTGMRPNQLNALTFDPNLYISPDALEFEWDSIDAEDIEEVFPRNETTWKVLDMLPPEYQVAIENMEWKADGEGRTRLPCFTGSHENDGWESSSNAMQVRRQRNGDLQFYCFKCRESPSTFFSADGNSEPKRHKCAPVRLKVADCERETQSLEAQRETLAREIQAVVEEKLNTEGQHVVNVTSAAGSGKTTIVITTYDNLFFLSKTTEEADQAFKEAEKQEKDCWRHRPRMHNRKEDNWDTLPFGLEANERPCMYPKVCNYLVGRGHEVVPTFCAQKCEHHSECRDVGFLKQLEIEPNKQSVFMAWNEMVFSDVRFASRVKKICAGNKLLVLDEANATQLPQQRVIPQKDLLDILEAWRLPVPDTYDIFIVLKKLIEALSTAKKTDKIREALAKSIQLLSDDDIAKIDDSLSRIPVGIVWKRDSKMEELTAIAIHRDTEKRLCLAGEADDENEPPAEGFDGTIPRSFAENGVIVDKMTVKKVELTTFERFGFCDMRKDAHTVPRRLVDFFSDIKAFVDSGSKACFKLDNGDIEFYLPPALNAKVGITLTASDTDNLIAEVYRPTPVEVTTITAPPPPFKPGSKVFQIATGRYTAKSALIEPGGERVRYQPDGTEVIESVWQPKPLFKRMLDIIHKAVLREVEGETVYTDTLVVAAKDIVENTEDPLVEELKENLFIHFVNHHHAEGRNDYQHCDLAFIFHFEPSPTELQKLAQIAFPNEDLSFEREEIDITVDGVTLEKVMRYTDERVQKVYNRECESRLMQAMMRLRPMMHENKYIFLFTAEPVRRIPVTPIPFTLPQLERFLEERGDIVEFEDYLKELAERSAKEIQEQDGVSRRQAFYESAENNKKSKQDDINEVLRLKEKGLSIRKIANKTGFSRGKVEGILRNSKVS